MRRRGDSAIENALASEAEPDEACVQLSQCKFFERFSPAEVAQVVKVTVLG